MRIALQTQLVVQGKRRHHERSAYEDKQQIIIGMRQHIGGGAHHTRQWRQKAQSHYHSYQTEGH